MPLIRRVILCRASNGWIIDFVTDNAPEHNDPAETVICKDLVDCLARLQEKLGEDELTS